MLNISSQRVLHNLPLTLITPNADSPAMVARDTIVSPSLTVVYGISQSPRRCSVLGQNRR